ncbi:biofilm regulation diguanylate cyclase SiaD [Vulcanococcus limneticus Candia 3F8]|uniref:biofilm regulation diguanylate cyclase SiaD n=1 Tax=Vulcanococcus limneticus TaxID=2170428 RepID=UPI0018E3AF35|nr:biofilm regulation diguanylate cyclase SiaD [Vulcanococcus limneticus]MCP9791451.1 biofilm regulation diguanylate cyclase SiaD [Vulcanococcus limneticus MW73D5]MCP9893392.1 biofilm regulation diguanylate cyclase SiaD [Vulcanococcus limneticus Candia 3F8]MCP9896760.1 biofilm regulation diguanylate cyclase SiaD [Vulcanococcus limneticus Candia 3B3]
MVSRPVITSELEQRIQLLLADESHRGHPLRDALEELWLSLHTHIADLEAIAQLPAASQDQSDLAKRIKRLTQQFERQVRQLERVIRISDRYQSTLKDLNATLRQASTHDSLTGIANRLLVEERCRQEDARAERSGSTYSLAVLDVDHFKMFNDCYGHDVGDLVLKRLGGTLKASLRQGDLCARWGGEEFLALLPDTSLSEAEHVVNRLLGKVRRQRIEHGNKELSVTASVGVAEHLPGETYEETFRRADQALLEAKKQGRDRYRLHQAT